MLYIISCRKDNFQTLHLTFSKMHILMTITHEDETPISSRSYVSYATYDLVHTDSWSRPRFTNLTLCINVRTRSTIQTVMKTTVCCAATHCRTSDGWPLSFLNRLENTLATRTKYSQCTTKPCKFGGNDSIFFTWIWHHQ